MEAQRFAVIDVETTGGYAGGHRITEVGIAISDGTKILETYHTLINPQKSIPQHITTLTGINNAMVQDAPTFAEVAGQIDALLDDAVFVAHNVNFDYSFIRMEMARLGLNFRRRKLCTARYARGLLTDQDRFGLARLAKRFNIVNEQPHRALSDALTAAQILHQLLKMDRQAVVKQKITRLEREVKLPLYLSPEQFHNIPNVPGIYKMFGANGKPVYIGKAKRLKQRVAQHFLQSDSARTQAFMKEVVHLETYPTGTELMALLKEDVEIRKFWPKYNSAQKQRNTSFHVVSYTDRGGITRLGIKKGSYFQDAIQTFSSQREALLWLHQTVDEHILNAAWCGLGSGWQDFEPPGKDEHNARMETIISLKTAPVQDRLVFLKGRNHYEKGFVWLKQKSVYALGFAPQQINWHNRAELEAHAEQVYPSTTLNNLVNGFLTSASETDVMHV